MTHKFFRMIILFALFLLVNKTVAQTGSGLDTLTQVNGWRLVKYVPGVTFAKTWFTNINPFHGRFSQFFEVDRLSPNVANDREYYALFKKYLKKRIKRSDYLQYSFNYSHSTPNLGIEFPLMDIAFGNNGTISNFRNIICGTQDNWVTFPVESPGSSDSIDCIYLQISGNFKKTVIQIDYLAFADPIYGTIFDIIDDFEDSTITDVGKEVAIPTTYSMDQNYPNPFNPSTTIKYSIPYVMTSLPDEVRLSNHNNTDVIPSLSSDEVHVTLKIYDLLGREVATLVDEYQKPGTYNYQLSTSNYKLSSGVYFYQLQAGNFIATKKLILLK